MVRAAFDRVDDCSTDALRETVSFLFINYWEKMNKKMFENYVFKEE